MADQPTELIIFDKSQFSSLQNRFSKKQAVLTEFLLTYFPKMDVIFSKNYLAELVHSISQMQLNYGEYLTHENQQNDTFYAIYSG